MKKILSFIALCLSFYLFSQKSAKLYTEVKQDSIFYYADNVEIYPISIAFIGQPELENLKMSSPFKTITVIPSKTTKKKISAFVIADKKKGWKIKKMPNYYTLAGDATQKNYDSNYQYSLPFQKGKSFLVYQGYNGTFSHQNENSLDFTMPEGTEILAARDGLVIDFVQTNNKSCPTQSCANLANYISILHTDGTIAQYFHLQQNGVKVKIGDQVNAGDVIGLSGNTGWSNGPHLHFVCFLPNVSGNKQRTTIKTLFKVNNGEKSEYLAEKKSYLKGY